MNNVARILLLVGGLVLALLIGVLIGRGQRIAQPTAEEGNAAAPAMQITTAPPPSAPAAPLAPLPAPTPAQAVAPPPAPLPKPAPDLQVQEDAAAVGMTTRDAAGQPSPDAAPPAPPKKAAASPDATQPDAQPVG